MKSLLLSLSFLTVSLQASYDDAHIRNLDNRVSALEQRKNGGGVILPSAGANIDDDVGLCIDAELLIWKAHQTGMNFAQQKVVQGLDYTGANTFVKPNFHFDPGVRINVGLRPEHDDWQLDATWTSFFNKAKRSINAGNTYFPLFMAADNLSPSSSINAVWRANLNMIDLSLSRASFMSKWMSVKPYIAIRNIWLYQKFNVGAVITSQSYESRMKSDMWAIGPMGGFELKFGMGQGFYFFNNTSAALVWGLFKNNQRSVGPSYSVPRSLDVHTSTYNFNIALGLGWDKRFDDNHYRLSIRGSWEHLALFNTNYFMSYADPTIASAFDTPNGNYTVEGFTLAVRFDF